MDVIKLIIILLIGAAAAGAAVVALMFAGIIVLTCFDLIFSIGGGILLWRSGHDNIGIVLIIAGLFFHFAVWLRFVDFLEAKWRQWFPPRQTPIDWDAPSRPFGTKAIYDRDGHVTGYVDKDD